MKMNVNNDAMGNRISKTVTNKYETSGDKIVTTYYVRDPQGNVLAVIFPIYRRRGKFPLT